MMAIYRLYRGVDVTDAVQAHERALVAPVEGYEVFNISGHSPFQPEDTEMLLTNAGRVIQRYHPQAAAWFAEKGWALPDRIDRVYVTKKAKDKLGWIAKQNFAEYLRK